jgi:probable HAF family extracellular repeat protein
VDQVDARWHACQDSRPVYRLLEHDMKRLRVRLVAALDPLHLLHRAATAVLASLAAAAPVAAQTTVVDITPDSAFASGLYDINSRGQAVGSAALGSGDDERAVVWQGGTLTDLGALPDYPLSAAAAINERGQIVGAATDGFRSRAVRWDGGAITDLTPPGWAWCVANDINNRGDVVGTCARPASYNVAVLWRDGAVTVLGVLPGSNESAAAAINDAGVVIGSAHTTSEDRSTAFRWVDGTMSALALPPGTTSTHAFDINAAGTIVGMATGPSGTSSQPVVWRGVGIAPLSGTWGSVSGEARGINNRGDVVGVAYGGIGGYVWSDGIFKPLTSPYGSLPQAISDRGVAVGLIQTEGGTPVHGAVWGKALTRIPPDSSRPVTAAPQPVFLGTLGGTSSNAIRINDRRQIIGYSTIVPDREETRPFLWENGVMRDLSTDPGELSFAYDLNDLGHIAGASADREDGSTYGAWWANGITNRLAFLPGSNSCHATAINNVGLIAGFCIVFPDPVRFELVGVFWRNAIIERIAVPADLQLYPLDVNDAGATIGIAFRGSEVFKFLWQNGVLTDIDEAAAGAFSEVVAINNRGDIAGYGPGPSFLQALLWDGQTTRAVGDPSTSNIAYGLNDLGDVAGGSNRSGAVWTNGRTIELPAPVGYTIGTASAINGGGDVTGNVSVSSTPYVWQAVYWPGATGSRTAGQD